MSVLPRPLRCWGQDTDRRVSLRTPGRHHPSSHPTLPFPTLPRTRTGGGGRRRGVHPARGVSTSGTGTYASRLPTLSTFSRDRGRETVSAPDLCDVVGDRVLGTSVGTTLLPEDLAGPSTSSDPLDSVCSSGPQRRHGSRGSSPSVPEVSGNRVGVERSLSPLRV